jgi:hypothetical protein
MSTRTARPGPGTGPDGPLNFVSGPARHYGPPCRARAARRLRRRPKPSPAGLFRASSVRNSPTLRVHTGGLRPASHPALLLELR